MTDSDLDAGRIASLLEARRLELARELDSLTAAPRDPMAPVSFGKRVGDGTTEAVERIHATSAARRLAQMAADVERALTKLSEGTYGVCDVCERRIPTERLEAIPWASRCVGWSRRS